MTALGNENQANAMLALAKVLGAQGLDILSDLSEMANDVTGLWSTLVKRLGASLLLLNTKVGEPLKGPWLAIMIAARAGNQIGLRQVQQGGRQVLQAFGKAAEDLNQWVNTTGKAIGAGRVADIVNSPAVKGSGGLVALVVLLLNTWNASHYLAQADVLEGMDQQRQNDTLSATLYAGAALVAVIDSQVRYKAADRAFTVMFPNIGRATFPAMTFFGAVIGALSLVAAGKEFLSLQIQIENAHGTLDPWLEMRRNVVGGHIAAYGTVAVLGLYYTARVVFGAMAVKAAIAAYSVWMGPLGFIIATLGVLYLISWYLQQTPMQNFLNYCCWSKARAKDLSPISFKDQQKELSRLYTILYAPRVSFVKRAELKGTSSHMGFLFTSYIDSLTIDLPGAEPGSVYLDITMIGNPRDTLAMRERVKNGEPRLAAEEPMQDVGDVWIHSSSCEWIPADEGQGLRLKGPFKREVANLFASQPTKVSLRLRYRTPLTSMLGALSYIGGERGVAFTLSEISGVVSLRNDPTPELDKATRYTLNGEQGSIYLQPGIK